MQRRRVQVGSCDRQHGVVGAVAIVGDGGLDAAGRRRDRDRVGASADRHVGAAVVDCLHLEQGRRWVVVKRRRGERRVQDALGRQRRVEELIGVGDQHGHQHVLWVVLHEQRARRLELHAVRERELARADRDGVVE